MGPHIDKSPFNQRGLFLFVVKDIGCYIIFSKKLDKHYVGVCQDNLLQRIRHHNTAQYGSHRFTSAADDWELRLFIPAMDYSHAVRMERKIKMMKSRVYIQNLLKYPELVEKIYNQTR